MSSRCGTDAGYMAHRKTPGATRPCDRCKAAHALEQRRRYAGHRDADTLPDRTVDKADRTSWASEHYNRRIPWADDYALTRDDIMTARGYPT